MKSTRKYLFYLLISYVIVLVVNIGANYQYYAAGNDWRPSIFCSLGIATFCALWLGLLNRAIFKRWGLFGEPTLRIVLASLIFAVEGAVMMVVVTKAAVWVLHAAEPSIHDYVNNSIYSALIAMTIGLMVTGHITLQHLKKNIEDTERMKQEMIQSQYETLKNQVNPHFLFNSLNTLTVMIPRQPEVAVNFVEQMSKVFRYSLQYSNENTIDLDTELKVVRSYLFLNEQRYDGKLITGIKIDEPSLQKRIITQSLLMLVENAIKHNEISHEHPLTINIYSEGKYLVVKNTLQPKSLIEKSTNVGLENIKKRYALASDNPVIVTQDNGQFIVKISLL